MPLSRVVVHGIDELRAALKSSAGRRLVLFTGSHRPDGVSWCPDCVTADPVVNKVLSSVPDADVTFITCFVGQIDYWRNPACPFRTDADIKISCIPTLIEYGTKKRLVDDQVANANMVKDLILDE